MHGQQNIKKKSAALVCMVELAEFWIGIVYVLCMTSEDGEDNNNNNN